MEPFNWLELQNGSDIRGIASEGISGENINLTPERVGHIAIAFSRWLSSKKNVPIMNLRIAVGRDSRISGSELANTFINAISSSGAIAVDCGLASTPSMYMSTVFEKTLFDGSVILTASHLPYNRNGIKFFIQDGGLDKQDITDILNMAAQIGKIQPHINNNVMVFDLISLYSDFLVSKIRSEINDPLHYTTPLNGFHIIVDAGNGAGGFFVDKVMKPLGAKTDGSQFLQPDGMFPNHIPNPEDDKAMQFIQNAVLRNSADLGIIFDTDVDRAAAVDNKGNSINRNNLIALIAAIVLEEHPGTYVVTDSVTSDGLTEFIEQTLGGKHHRFQRGYKNVINEAINLDKNGKPCWLAIETSGHGALKENYFLDDGAYLMTKILIKVAKQRLNSGKMLLDLIKELHQPEETNEFRIKIHTIDFKTYGDQIITDLETFTRMVPGWKIVPDNYEGIRVSCDKDSGYGWFLLRMSLHDPVMPLNIESDVSGGVLMITNKLYLFFERYPELDISNLMEFIES